MADAEELTIRLEHIEKAMEREIVKREESNKYMHRMVEDVQVRYQEIALSFGRIEAAFHQHLEDDRRMATSIDKMDGRMRTLERLTWIAVGGVTVVGGLVAIFGIYIIRILGAG